mmetsp:Transcript_55117/g.167529  ORF Transcript_55117/g.167529 Transcript_55117/m.167529 type:complete len:309 (-) Transcript_55117:197-1123(-)
MKQFTGGVPDGAKLRHEPADALETPEPREIIRGEKILRHVTNRSAHGACAIPWLAINVVGQALLRVVPKGLFLEHIRHLRQHCRLIPDGSARVDGADGFSRRLVKRSQVACLDIITNGLHGATERVAFQTPTRRLVEQFVADDVRLSDKGVRHRPPESQETLLQRRSWRVQLLPERANLLSEVIIGERMLQTILQQRRGAVSRWRWRAHRQGRGKRRRTGKRARRVALELIDVVLRETLAAKTSGADVLMQIHHCVNATPGQLFRQASHFREVGKVDAPRGGLDAWPHDAQAHHVEPPTPQVVHRLVV